MAKAGEILANPVLNETIQFVKTAADTGGELLEMEATYKPNSGWDSSVEHYHPYQDERFEVIEGLLSVRVNGQERTYAAGESFDIPRQMPHIMCNRSSKPVRFRWQVRPALNTETFFETIWGLAADGKTNDHGVPNLLQFAVIARAYDNVFRLINPPHWLQQTLFGLLAPIGRLLGYRPYYDCYTDPQSIQINYIE